MTIRVGFGYDVHRLTTGHILMLGGIEIPFDRGLAGWSDADVLIHAIMDGLLGAACLGDIGTHFPPSDPRYEHISSITLLSKVSKLLKDGEWEIGNIDTTIVAQQPTLAPFIDTMRQKISETLGIKTDQISIKATTTEGLGFAGRSEGIAAYAIVLINKNNK